MLLVIMCLYIKGWSWPRWRRLEIGIMIKMYFVQFVLIFGVSGVGVPLLIFVLKSAHLFYVHNLLILNRVMLGHKLKEMISSAFICFCTLVCQLHVLIIVLCENQKSYVFSRFDLWTKNDWICFNCVFIINRDEIPICFSKHNLNLSTYIKNVIDKPFTISQHIQILSKHEKKV